VFFVLSNIGVLLICFLFRSGPVGGVSFLPTGPKWSAISSGSWAQNKTASGLDQYPESYLEDD
jgi:hypothetical protein